MGELVYDRGSPVNSRGLRAVTLAGAALVLSMAAVACSAAQPSPIVIVVTPPPATSAPTATEAPATPLATITPWPTESPTPVVTPAPTPAPVKSAAAPTPISGATSAPGVCIGTASNLTFLQSAKAGVKTAVYCATKMTAGWVIATGNWAGNKSGGWVTISYKFKNTNTTVDVAEGAFCLTGAAACSPNTGHVGSATFGGLAGSLNTTADGFAIYVAPGTAHAYSVTGHNIAKATLVAIAANMTIVPKPV
jgi:hypothetical protein